MFKTYEETIKEINEQYEIAKLALSKIQTFEGKHIIKQINVAMDQASHPGWVYQSLFFTDEDENVLLLEALGSDWKKMRSIYQNWYVIKENANEAMEICDYIISDLVYFLENEDKCVLELGICKKAIGETVKLLKVANAIETELGEDSVRYDYYEWSELAEELREAFGDEFVNVISEKYNTGGGE